MEQQEQAQEVEQPAVEQQENQELDLKAELEKLKSTNERLLSESQQYKQRYNEIKKSIEAKKEKELEGAPTDEKLKAIEERAKELENKYSSVRERAVYANLKAAMVNLASDANDVSDLINSDLVVNAIDVDDDTLEVDADKLGEAINQLREAKPYLFKNNKVPKMKDAQPKANLNEKPLSQLSDSEKKQRLKQALKGLV